MTTELQQERQQQAGQANLEAIQGINITPNQGAVVPNVMQLQGLLEQMQSAKNSLPNINPPGEDEIRKTSWIASGVIGLLGAIVSGNAAGGIAAGMVAALAIHDRGYDLRQRADLVPELHQQGYTARAILNWYETGDNKELDKEAQEREQLASRQATIDMQGAQMKQQAEFHKDQIEQQGLNRSQQASIAYQAHLDRMATAIGAKKSSDIVAAHQHERENYNDIANGLGTGNKVNRDNWEKAKAAYAKFESALQMGDIPVAQEQMLMMAQIIDASNLSPQLSKMHFFTTAAQHGPMDWLHQLALRIAHNGSVTTEEMADIRTVFEAAERAAEKNYEQSVRDTLSGYDLSDPQALQHAVSYSGLPLMVIKTMGKNPVAQQFGSGASVGNSENSQGVTYREPE
ncbi:hypothetical protein ACEF96_003136 [Salmonella enterica]|nr:hypothetical protein [Salmonella enterica]